MLQIILALLILLFLGLFMVLSVPMSEDEPLKETAGETTPPAKS